jgi:LCP family protein required for cell wall assembly
VSEGPSGDPPGPRRADDVAADVSTAGQASWIGSPVDVAVADEPALRHPIWNYSGHIVVALLSVLVLLVTGVYWNIKANGDAGLATNNVDIGSDDSLITEQATAPAVGNRTYTAENILMVGSDTRSGANNIDNSGLTGIANTDSIMVLHLSADRRHISVVSLPRDLWAPNVKCNNYDQATNTYGALSSANRFDKQHINSFYGVGGPKCLVDAVQNLLQLNITKYIQIDFAGFQAMVDALGGITVNACRPVVDAVLSTVLPSAGEQTINGGQALSLARARDVIGDTESDKARIRRQQRILSTILRTAKSASVLTNPNKLSDFVTAFTHNTTTSGLTFDTMLQLAESLGDLDPTRVTFYTIPTVPDPADTSNRGSMYVDKTGAAGLLNALRNDLPVPGTQTTPATTPSSPVATTSAPSAPSITVAPSAVDVQVVNATGRAGVAGTVADAMRAVGFALSADDLLRVDTVETASTIHYQAGNEAAALTVALSFPTATLVPRPNMGSTVSLRVGSSYTDERFATVNVGDPIPAALLAQIPEGSSANVIQPSTTVASSPGGSTTATIQQINAGDESCL